jgi:uncharacterized protein (DUF1501 family)
MQRRVFVKSGALALVTLGLSPSFLRRSAFAAELSRAKTGKVLVCLFQRGAADALNVVVPHGERASPHHAIPRLARERRERARPHGWLHPLGRSSDCMPTGLRAIYAKLRSPSATRSHFDAQDHGIETRARPRPDGSSTASAVAGT